MVSRRCEARDRFPRDQSVHPAPIGMSEFEQAHASGQEHEVAANPYEEAVCRAPVEEHEHHGLPQIFNVLSEALHPAHHGAEELAESVKEAEELRESAHLTSEVTKAQFNSGIH